MKKITLITGGQRSGKSSHALTLAEAESASPVFLATARYWDNDYAARIKRHQDDRGPHWQTIEENINISQHDLSGKVVLLDCITLWLNNIFYDNQYNVDKSIQIAKEEWDRFIDQDFNLFVVTNEIGMGVHAENEMSRKFADLQGWINQFIAKKADNVIFMVSGIPVKVK